MTLHRPLTTAAVLLAVACGGPTRTRAPVDPALARPGHAVASPSGAFRLVVDLPADDKVFDVHVEDASGTIVARPSAALYARYRTLGAWDGEGRAWIYSGDLGVQFLARDAVGTWHESDWAGGGLTPPDAIVHAAPSLFRASP